MNVLGTAYMNGCNYQVGYDLLSTNQAGGYHTLRVYGVLNVTNNYISWSRGTARVWDNTVGIGTYYGKGSYTLVSTDIKAYCDASGNVSVYVGGSLDTSFVSSGEVGGTAYLPNIPRNPTITSAPNFTDRDNPTMYFTTNTMPNATYNACISLTGAKDDVPYRQINISSGSYTFNLTPEDRKALRGNTPAGSSKNVMFFLRTDSGGQSYYSTMTKTMTVVRRPVKIMRNGSWVNSFPYVRVNGQWKEAKPYIRVNGSWKEEK